MKKIHWFYTVSLVISLFCIMASKPVEAVAVAQEYTILLGNKTNCLPAFHSTKNIKYTYVSLNKKIATVHKTKGTITPKKSGKVLIKVQKKPKGKKATSTYYRVKIVEMKVKGSTVVNAGNKAAYQTNIKNIKVKWEISDETIATISEAGVLTALAQGDVTVIASYKDALAVREVSVVSSTNPLCITSQTERCKSGDMIVFTANKENVIWSSSHPAVAAVDKNSGLVIAKSNGTTTITAKTKDGKETAASILTVSGGESTLSIYAGNTNLTLLEERYITSNMAGTKWMSSNPDIVFVDAQTGYLIANNYGTATIYAVCGTETAMVQFTVSSNSTKLSITSTARTFQIGTSSYLTSNKSGTTWYSTNPDVAVIDRNTGLLRAMSYGTATIYAVCGAETVSITITVTSTGSNLEVKPTKTTFTVGTYTYLTTNQNNVVWTSSDTNVAAIEAETGLLYAKGVGSAVIYASFANQVVSIPITVIANTYTSEQLAAKNSAVNAINNIPNPVTEYNLDSVKTYLTIAKGKIDTAKTAGVSVNDITNYKDYQSLLDGWLKVAKVPGTNVPLAVQKGTDMQAIETAISAMQSAVNTSSMSQRLASVNAIETSIIKAESTYLMERSELTNYTVYQKERNALGLK